MHCENMAKNCLNAATSPNIRAHRIVQTVHVSLTVAFVHLCRIITDYLEKFSDDKKNSSNSWTVITEAHEKYLQVCVSENDCY